MEDTSTLVGSPLKTPNRNLLSTKVAEILREAILTRQLDSGQRLVEDQLCKELDVSRGPVREALRELEEEGLVSSEPHRGTFVYSFSVGDVIEMLTLRALIEPIVVGRAMQFNGPAVAASLNLLLDEMRQEAAAGDNVGVAKTHTRFHGVFYENCRHRLFQRIWKLLVPTIRINLQIFQTTFHSLEDLPHEHESIASHATSGDTARLDKAIRDHFYVNGEPLVETYARFIEQDANR